MKVGMAKIVDSTHLDLTVPIPAQPGKLIQVSILDEGEGDRLWRETANKHLSAAYDDGDSIYDAL